MIKWQTNINYSESECGRYKITNTGEKKGNRYCLWGKKHDCFCLMLGMGTRKEVLDKANLIKEKN